MRIPKRSHTHRNVTYWQQYVDAEKVAEELRLSNPQIRLVAYDRGWAIQKHESGPYYDETQRAFV